MENNKKFRDLYELYIELGHDAFEEKIKNLWRLVCIIVIAMLLA
jgi:hypothetical protein